MKDIRTINPKDVIKEKSVCLTLDLEYDHADLLPKKYKEGFSYLLQLKNFFKERNLPLTVFVQGEILEKDPEVLKNIGLDTVEFELHSYSHRNDAVSSEEITKSYTEYKRFFGEKPKGYRSPKGVICKEDVEKLSQLGFEYDSSIFPSFRSQDISWRREGKLSYNILDFKIGDRYLLLVNCSVFLFSQRACGTCGISSLGRRHSGQNVFYGRIIKRRLRKFRG